MLEASDFFDVRMTHNVIMIHGFKAINLNPGIIPEKILFGGNIEKAPVSILNTA